jgi:rare lipoprotein A
MLHDLICRRTFSGRALHWLGIPRRSELGFVRALLVADQAFQCDGGGHSESWGISQGVICNMKALTVAAAVAALVLLEVPVLAEDCVASVYAVGDSSQPGTKTASGIPLNDNAMTAAHKSLRFGSKVRVINKKNGHAVTVTVTDRGPYVKGRCIDLSKAGAGALGFAALAPVSVVPVVSD